MALQPPFLPGGKWGRIFFCYETGVQKHKRCHTVFPESFIPTQILGEIFFPHVTHHHPDLKGTVLPPQNCQKDFREVGEGNV